MVYGEVFGTAGRLEYIGDQLHAGRVFLLFYCRTKENLVSGEIVAFSKYLAYAVGGAEISMRQLLLSEPCQRIRVVAFANVGSFNARARPLALCPEWIVELVEGVRHFKYFPYWEYVINRKAVRRYMARFSPHARLYTYALYAPAAIIGFAGQATLFLRSETDLGIDRNYYTGVRFLLRAIYALVEWPARAIYRSDLRRAIGLAKVVCNSRYMAARLRELYGKVGEVRYPPIDADELRERYERKRGTSARCDILFVGDSVVKGLPLVLKLARRLRHRQFLIVSRNVAQERREDNLVWTPWHQDPVEVFVRARLVIVPSVWEEAYGRVAREACVLGLPVLVSRIGGLPEAVEGRADSIVDDYRNVEEWARRVEARLGQGD